MYEYPSPPHLTLHKFKIIIKLSLIRILSFWNIHLIWMDFFTNFICFPNFSFKQNKSLTSWFFIRICSNRRVNLDKHLKIKICKRSFKTFMVYTRTSILISPHLKIMTWSHGNDVWNFFYLFSSSNLFQANEKYGNGNLQILQGNVCLCLLTQCTILHNL